MAHYFILLGFQSSETPHVKSTVFKVGIKKVQTVHL